MFKIPQVPKLISNSKDMSKFILVVALAIIFSVSAVNSQVTECNAIPATSPCRCNVGTCTVGQGCIPGSSFCTSRNCPTSALVTAPCICNSAMCLPGHFCSEENSACLSLDSCSGGVILQARCLCGTGEDLCNLDQVCTVHQSRCNTPTTCPNFGPATAPCFCGENKVLCLTGQMCSGGMCSS